LEPEEPLAGEEVAPPEAGFAAPPDGGAPVEGLAPPPDEGIRVEGRVVPPDDGGGVALGVVAPAVPEAPDDPLDDDPLVSVEVEAAGVSNVLPRAEGSSTI